MWTFPQRRADSEERHALKILWDTKTVLCRNNGWKQPAIALSKHCCIQVISPQRKQEAQCSNSNTIKLSWGGGTVKKKKKMQKQSSLCPEMLQDARVCFERGCRGWIWCRCHGPSCVPEVWKRPLATVGQKWRVGQHNLRFKFPNDPSSFTMGPGPSPINLCTSLKSTCMSRSRMQAPHISLSPRALWVLK